MPFFYEIDSQREMVNVVADGPVNVSMVVETMDRVATDLGFPPEFKLLIDLREMSYAAPSGDAREIATAMVAMKSTFKNRVALVTCSQFHFGMIRVSCSLAEAMGYSTPIMPFYDYEEACTWLNENQ